MLPKDLAGDSFSAYPQEARKIATGQVALLRELPLSFVPLLLRELIAYDWKFPAERKELDDQFAHVARCSPEARQLLMSGFAKLRLSSQLEHFDWVNAPAQFSEQLTTHLWATHQIDAFRSAATDYIQRVHAAAPHQPLPCRRLGLVVLGKGVTESKYQLFRKLRPHGVYYSKVRPENGVRALLEVAAARAKAHPVPYGHWYIDGGAVSFYGGTGGGAGYGTVFSLSDSGSFGQPWAENVFDFYPFGDAPSATLVVGSRDVLYGTMRWSPEAFMLTPPAWPGGSWTGTYLSSLSGVSGTKMVIDGNGVLYGTTGYYPACPQQVCCCGVIPRHGSQTGGVYSLTPPAPPAVTWTYTVLYTHTGSLYDGPEQLTLGSDGVLYSATAYGGPANAGTIFSLTPPASPGGAWTKKALHGFTGANGMSPNGGLVIGPNGVLFGTTYGDLGTVFALRP